MTTFAQLGLSEPLLEAVNELGFETPSEIQAKAIPELLSQDRNFIGLAQTGTGKTAAFGLPLLSRIDAKQKHTQGLILAPTRELGKQIAEQIDLFSKHLPKLNVLAVYGGAGIVGQIQALKRPQQIIIATPGRLIDLIKRKAVKLQQLEFLVLDEADEMLNMGFKEELDEILSYTPAEKLTWLFSATMPPEMNRIVKKYMDNPIELRVNTKNEVNVNIEHLYSVVKTPNKAEALSRFLDVTPEMRGVVFCRTRRDTQNLAEVLLKKGYRADAIHGDLAQTQRERVMKRFKSHELQVLIATDVAARGIDVNDLTHVFHFSLPDEVAYYTHRSGRTARAGKSGISIAFIGAREKGRIDHLARSLDISFEQVQVPQIEQIYESRIEGWARDVLGKSSKGKVPQDLLETVSTLFGNLTKEELVAKLVTIELDKLNVETTKDLNTKQQASRGGDHRGGGGRRGSRGGGKNFGNKKKKYGGEGGDGGRKRSRKGKKRHWRN